MKKWLVTLSMCLSFIIAPIVTAQSMAGNPVPPDDGLPAHVFVRKLVFDKKEYNAGDEVHGSFVLYNADERIVSDANYLIRLQGVYASNGSASVLYDVKSNGPVFLKGNEERLVEFKYQLPAAVAGHVGIRIQAMLTTGFPLGWADQQFTINGESRFIDVGLAYLQIKDTQFALESGPTVDQDQEIVVKASLHNPNKNDSTVIPVVTIYNRSIASDPLETTRRDPITIKAGETTSIALPLPTFGDTARVYAGTVGFVDTSGNTVGNPFTVRYIVGGVIANIERISTTQQSVKKGETITVRADVSASPVSFGTNGKNMVITDVGRATFKIQVLNEHDDVVAQTTQEINFDDALPHRSFTLPANRDAQQLKIRSSVVKNGKELALYATDLEKVKPEDKGGTGSQQAKTSNTPIIGGIAVILALVAIAFVINKRHG